MKTISKLTFTTLAALAVALVFQAPVTRADNHGQNGDENNGAATVTWTKWVTAFYPDGPTGIFGTIAGITGGDVGDGTLIGEALTAVPQPDGITVLIEADYHFYGSKHSCTVHLYLVQTNLPDGITGVVTGVVTEGWLKGNRVEGTYIGYESVEGVAGFSFDGSLEIKKGSKNDD